MSSPPSPTYIDYELFLSPTFSPCQFANSLILSTNNASDTPLDLTTPLSRVLFDIQEIDTHIHHLTARCALPLLTDTAARSQAGQRIVSDVGAQMDTLQADHHRLQREVLHRWEVADQVREVTERLWRTVRSGRLVGRCLGLGRQLEAQIGGLVAGSGTSRGTDGDHRAMVRAANTLVALKEMFAAAPAEEQEEEEDEGGGGGGGGGGRGDQEGLNGIRVAVTVRDELMKPAERQLMSRAQQIVREFSMGAAASSSSLSSSSSSSSSSSGISKTTTTTTTYNQTEEIKSRTTSALLTLHLLSPTTLLSTLQSHLQTALTSSLASLTRTLLATTSAGAPSNNNTNTTNTTTTTTNLDRTLLEISSRCQSIVALEALLQSIRPASSPTTTTADGEKEKDKETERERERDGEEEQQQQQQQDQKNLLQPLLKALDTTSLPSHFWRALAGGLSSRAAAVGIGSQAARGGGAMMGLGPERIARVRELVRECVIRGFGSPGSSSSLSYGGMGMGMGRQEGGGGGGGGGARVSREREVAVMVGAVLGVLSGGGGGGR
ncbi:MAG: hypothetical protein M1816_003860 [Peltula sp. TS41687]|nr:MAG: hypothetical protein M1816_003860 [Peltula sp. TS41687]